MVLKVTLARYSKHEVGASGVRAFGVDPSLDVDGRCSDHVFDVPQIE